MPDIEDIYPLSPTQQGLLFHSLLAPGAGLYVPQIVLSLSGTLDGGRLQAAWHNTLQRHRVYLGLVQTVFVLHHHLRLLLYFHRSR